MREITSERLLNLDTFLSCRTRLHIEIETKLIVIRLSEITLSETVGASNSGIIDAERNQIIRSVAKIDKSSSCWGNKSKKVRENKLISAN